MKASIGSHDKSMQVKHFGPPVVWDLRPAFFQIPQILRKGKIHSGILYGTNYIAYHNDRHGEHLIRVLPFDKEIQVLQMVAVLRVANSANKKVLFCDDDSLVLEFKFSTARNKSVIANVP